MKIQMHGGSHPWTNGQVERMNRTLKEATVKTFNYASHDQLKEHLHAYLKAYNFAKRLRSISGKTPWQFILDSWTSNPEYFRLTPNHFFPGPNIPSLKRKAWFFHITQDKNEIRESEHLSQANLCNNPQSSLH